MNLRGSHVESQFEGLSYWALDDDIEALELDTVTVYSSLDVDADANYP